MTRTIGAASPAAVQDPNLPHPDRIDFLAMFTDAGQRNAACQILDAASRFGMLRYRYNKTSISIRAERPPPAKPITLAWLHHPGSPGRADGGYEFVFGVENEFLEDTDVGGALGAWVEGIAEIEGVDAVRWPRSTAWSVPYILLSANADFIVESMSKKMSELRGER